MNIVQNFNTLIWIWNSDKWFSSTDECMIHTIFNRCQILEFCSFFVFSSSSFYSKMSFEHIDRLTHWLVFFRLRFLCVNKRERTWIPQESGFNLVVSSMRWHKRKKKLSYRLFVFVFGNWLFRFQFGFRTVLAFSTLFHTSLTYSVVLMM